MSGGRLPAVSPRVCFIPSTLSSRRVFPIQLIRISWRTLPVPGWRRYTPSTGLPQYVYICICIRACERSAAQFPLPAQEDVRSFALPLNVVPGRSAQNRSALILNFLPLQRNRSTLRSNFQSTSQTPSCYSRGHTSQCCGGGDGRVSRDAFYPIRLLGCSH